VNQPAADTAEHPQQPQDQQNNQYCPQHCSPPGVGRRPCRAPRGRYPDSGFHFTCYACSISVSVQYGTFSKIIGSYRVGTTRSIRRQTILAEISFAGLEIPCSDMYINGAQVVNSSLLSGPPRVI
jgi:hypothetical protein